MNWKNDLPITNGSLMKRRLITEIVESREERRGEGGGGLCVSTAKAPSVDR